MRGAWCGEIHQLIFLTSKTDVNAYCILWKSDEKLLLGRMVSPEVIICDILKLLWMLALVGLRGSKGSLLICNLPS